MNCLHCTHSQYAEPFGLWCLLRDEKAWKVCECWQREPGSDDE